MNEVGIETAKERRVERERPLDDFARRHLAVEQQLDARQGIDALHDPEEAVVVIALGMEPLLRLGKRRKKVGHDAEKLRGAVALAHFVAGFEELYQGRVV